MYFYVLVANSGEKGDGRWQKNKPRRPELPENVSSLFYQVPGLIVLLPLLLFVEHDQCQVTPR